MTPLTLLVWTITCLIWSTVWLFIKIGVRDVPPATFAVFRLAIALIVVIPIVARRRSRLPRRWRDYALIAATGVVLLGMNFSDQLHFAGAAALRGSVAVVAGAVCVAGAYVAMRRYGRDLDPVVITAGQMSAAIWPLLAYAISVEGNPLAARWTPASLLSVVYLALLGSVAAAWMNYWLLKRIGATRLLVMGLVEPLLAVLLGAVVLGETLTGRAVFGGVLILVSTALALDLWKLAGPTESRTRR